MSSSRLEKLHRTNRMLTRLMWVALLFSVVWNATTNAPQSVIMIVGVVGGLICLTMTLFVWRRWMVRQVMYGAAVSLSVLAYLILEFSPSFANYMMVYFCMGVLAFYHNYRPLVISTVLGIGITNYFYWSGHPIMQGFNVDDMMSLNLFLLLMSSFLIAQAVTHEKNMRAIEDHEEVLRSANQRFEQLIAEIGTSAEEVSSSAEELTASADQTTQAVQHIAESVYDMRQGADNQVRSIEESSNAISEISRAVSQIAENAQHVSSNAQHTSQLARAGDDAIQTVSHQMDSINRTMSELSNVVRGLGERSVQIGEILDAITAISQQTNLLALNAAIEAARAGEHGRGFAVVADEVRKLAEQTGQSAQEITLLVASIQGETEAAVKSMEIVAREVHDGLTVAREAGQSFEQIRQSIDVVANQVQDVSSASEQMAIGTERVVHSIQRIEQIALTSANSTREVSAATEQQLATMEEITASATLLSELADRLREMARDVSKN